MKFNKAMFHSLLLVGGVLQASPVVDEAVFGKMLGGWTEKDERAADFEVSGSVYRIWKPHISPTLDGGIFVSVRIDHLRGFLASDDHASLELSFDEQGSVSTAQSSIALQGRKISSDLIQGGAKAGTSLVGMDRAAKVGTDLVGNLSAKLLREKVSEPGRVGFPAVLRHTYNLLCLSVHNMDRVAVVAEKGVARPEGVAVAAVPLDPLQAERGAEVADQESAGRTTPGGEEALGTAEGDAEGDKKAAGAGSVDPVVTKRKALPPLEVKEHGAEKAVKLPGSPKQ